MGAQWISWLSLKDDADRHNKEGKSCGNDMVTPSSSTDRDRLTPAFWETRYQEGTTRWDLGQAAPTFICWLSQEPRPQPGKTIVLGCGRGHDALLLARHGFEVLGVDYAPSAIAAAQQTATAQKLDAQFIQRDIFELLPEYQQQFDYVIEHTCFCAIEPSLRDRYLDLVHQLLKPAGKAIGIFFTHRRPGGPPYGVTPQDIEQLFKPKFEIETLIPAPQSVSQRQGEEHFGIFQKRS